MPSAITIQLNPSADSIKRPVRVLYLDDMKELRDFMRISLSRDGHEIECFAEGEIALERVAASPAPDLVITDHHMPGMNGLEFVAQLRERGFPGKIVVFSSDVSPKVAAEYRRLAVARIIYKPVYPSELRKTISELFAAPASEMDRDSSAPFLPL